MLPALTVQSALAVAVFTLIAGFCWTLGAFICGKLTR